MHNVESTPYALYIEDDIEDVELLNYALAEKNIILDIVHAWNGVEALNLLEEMKGYKPLPSLIFLDINMSKIDGKETFICLKADKDIAKIPVVILSTSNDKSDKEYFSKFNIPYIVKPGDVNKFKEELYKTMKECSALEFDWRQIRNIDAA